MRGMTQGSWASGDWESLGPPGSLNLQGFDEWFGYLNQGHAHNYYPEYLWRNQEKVTIEGNQNGQRNTYSHDLFVQEATSFIERHKGESLLPVSTSTIPHANNERGAQTTGTAWRCQATSRIQARTGHSRRKITRP